MFRHCSAPRTHQVDNRTSSPEAGAQGIRNDIPHPPRESVRLTVSVVPLNVVVNVSPTFAAKPVLAQLALDTVAGHASPAEMLSVLVFDPDLPTFRIVVPVPNRVRGSLR